MLEIKLVELIKKYDEVYGEVRNFCDTHVGILEYEDNGKLARIEFEVIEDSHLWHNIIVRELKSKQLEGLTKVEPHDIMYIEGKGNRQNIKKGK